MPKIEDMYPLSPTQAGLLFHTLLTPTHGIYSPQVVLRMAGKDIQPAVLKRAWEEVVKKHGVFRTGVEWEQRDEPFQVVYRDAALSWTEQDWSSFESSQQDLKLNALLAANRTEPFNLHRPPLMRLTWIRRSDDAFFLVWCYHHLILDGWSASLVLQEVFQNYTRITQSKPELVQDEVNPISDSIELIKTQDALPETSVSPYSAYIAWLRRQSNNAAEDFWRSHLDDVEQFSVLQSIRDESQNEDVSHGMDELEWTLSDSESQKIRNFAHAHSLTLNSVLLGVLGLLFARYNDSRNIVVGTTVAGRPPALAGSTSMIGLFINTLPVRIKIHPNARSTDWLTEFQEQQAETSEYDHVSLRDIQQWTNNGQRLFDCLFVFESYPVPTAAALSKKGSRLEGIEFDEWTHLPLTLLVTEDKKIHLRAKYLRQELSKANVEQLLNHYSRLLLEVVCRPAASLSELVMISESERDQIHSWNETHHTWQNRAKTLLDLTHAASTLESEAVRYFTTGSDGNRSADSISYRELHQRAEAVAYSLSQYGVSQESRVGVYLERGLQLSVATLAILKAGATYVPLDPNDPEQRLSAIIEQVDPTVILMASSQQLVPLKTNIHCVDLDDAVKISANQRSPLEIHPKNSAYIIHTSGTTGLPKGVVNTHSGIVNRLLWMQKHFQLTEHDRVLQKTPVGFDVSVWELFWPLISGATLVMAEPGRHKDVAYLTKLIRQERITTLHFVPPMLDAFLEDPDAHQCETLRRVICSGESLSLATQKRFFEVLPQVELHNLYGPTEAAIDVTAWKCSPLDNKTIPIGHPIANTSIHLLDRDLNEVPIGVEGDLYIGGQNLARGYLQRAALSAEAFIPNPLRSRESAGATSEILYRTGDRGCYRSDGAIEFLGRSDHQVKLRGNRIELSEIETALTGSASVRQALVILHSPKSADDQLVAYLVLNDPPDEQFVKDPTAVLTPHLRELLPAVMIPTHYIVLSELPLRSNGKVDRSKLPEPDQLVRSEWIAPSSATEVIVAEVWREVLKIENIGIHDSFFDLGGHSLSATRANTRLRQRLEVDLELRTLFEYPVLEDLANQIDARRIGSDSMMNEDDVKFEI